MPMATLTSKGQVTIPKEVRDSLHLNTGDKIGFFITDHGEVLLRPATKRVDEVFGMLHKSGQKSVSIEQMDLAIKQKMRESFK